MKIRILKQLTSLLASTAMTAAMFTAFAVPAGAAPVTVVNGGKATIYPTDDMQLRTGHTDQSSTNATLEIKHNSYTDGAGDNGFLGAMKFEIPDGIEADRIKSAKLELVTVTRTVSSKVKIKPYDYDWNEDKSFTYENQQTNITAALEAEAITEFVPEYGGENLFEAYKVTSDSRTIDKWTSSIDLKNYVYDKLTNGNKTVSLLFTPENYTSANNRFVFMTKDASSDTYGTTDKTQWKDVDEPEASEEEISRWASILRAFNLTEADHSALYPRLVIDYEPVPEGAKSVFSLVNDKGGNRDITMQDSQKIKVAASNANNSVYYIGDYDISQIEKIEVKASLKERTGQDSNGPALINFAYEEIADGNNVDSSYVSTNNGDIRSPQKKIGVISGKTEYTSSNANACDDYAGAVWTIDSSGVTVDAESYKQYPGGTAEVVNDGSNPSVALSNPNKGKVHLFMYATAQSGRAVMDYVKVYTKDGVAFKTRAEYRKTDDNTADMRFIANPDAGSQDGSIDGYGFWLVNIGDLKTYNEDGKQISGSETLEADDSFYYDLKNMVITGATETTQSGIYAVPYVKIGENIKAGQPFKYDGPITGGKIEVGKVYTGTGDLVNHEG